MADDLRGDLDAFVAGWEPGDTDVVNGELEWQTPVDLDQANRMMRRQAWLERELREINALASAEMDRIAAWRADRAAGAERAIASIERALEGFARAHNEKTVNLPNGVLKLRKPRPRVEITDQAAFSEWAHERWLQWQLGRRVVTLLAGRELWWQPVAAEPYKVTFAAVKSEIAKLAAGDVTSETEDEVWRRFVDPETGEPVPGVVQTLATKDTFGASTARTEPTEEVA